jgi:inner membrane protein
VSRFIVGPENVDAPTSAMSTLQQHLETTKFFMPSVFGHAVAAVALGTAFPRSRLPRSLWVLGVVCAAAPDLDAIGFALGVPYGHLLGHRGLSHSLLFAVALALFVTVMVCLWRGTARHWRTLFAYLALCGISHGILDAFTNGGLGVAFLAPFSNERYFFPWRPILVAPIGVGAFFSRWGAEVLISEAVWVGIPSVLFALLAVTVRRCLDSMQGQGPQSA